MTRIVRFADLYPDAPPVGRGPYHCHECGASIDEAQVARTLIADWAWCPACWALVLAALRDNGVAR